MNKILLLIILCLVSFNSYAKDIAPFGGTIVEDKDNITIEYTRFDGSVFTKFSTSNDWYLKKKSDDPKAEIPSFVKTKLPITIVYTNFEGEEFASMNLRKWLKYDSKVQNSTNVDSENNLTKNLQLIQYPENPVNNNLLLKINLKNNSKVEFQIINTQGSIIRTITQSMSSGLNTIKMNISDLSNGTYFYKIVAEDEILNKKFIKIK